MVLTKRRTLLLACPSAAVPVAGPALWHRRFVAAGAETSTSGPLAMNFEAYPCLTPPADTGL
jgi:hypothetical protein